jgi:hypothetical protein
MLSKPHVLSLGTLALTILLVAGIATALNSRWSFLQKISGATAVQATVSLSAAPGDVSAEGALPAETVAALVSSNTFTVVTRGNSGTGLEADGFDRAGRRLDLFSVGGGGIDPAFAHRQRAQLLASRVPEPTTALLLGVGISVALVARDRRGA